MGSKYKKSSYLPNKTKKKTLSIYLSTTTNLPIQTMTRTTTIVSLILTMLVFTKLGFVQSNGVKPSEYEKKRLEMAILKDMKKEINMLAMVEIKAIAKGANLRELKFNFYDGKDSDWQMYENQVAKLEKDKEVQKWKNVIMHLERRIRTVTFRYNNDYKSWALYSDLVKKETKADKKAKYQALADRYEFLVKNSQALLDYQKKEIAEIKKKCEDCNRRL